MQLFQIHMTLEVHFKMQQYIEQRCALATGNTVSSPLATKVSQQFINDLHRHNSPISSAS